MREETGFPITNKVFRRCISIRNYEYLRENNPMRAVTKRQAFERLGEIRENCQGELMEIIGYRSATDIDIQFRDTGNVLEHQSYNNFTHGAIKDYCLPTFYNRGIKRHGRLYDDNGNRTLAFGYWDDMLKRCYNQNDLERYPMYSDCYVCDEWLDLPTFELWVEDNYYQCGSERMVLDKDILYKGNRLYSPDTAIFVPERINGLLTKTNRSRGDYPIGVYYKAKNRKFVAQVSKLNNELRGTKRQEYLGLFDTPEEAFLAYKVEKERYIKQVADHYYDKYPNFPARLYDALYSYTVDIDD